MPIPCPITDFSVSDRLSFIEIEVRNVQFLLHEIGALDLMAIRNSNEELRKKMWSMLDDQHQLHNEKETWRCKCLNDALLYKKKIKKLRVKLRGMGKV